MAIHITVTLTATGTKFAGFYVAAYAPTDVNFTTTIGKMSARGGTISSYTNVKCTGVSFISFSVV